MNKQSKFHGIAKKAMTHSIWAIIAVTVTIHIAATPLENGKRFLPFGCELFSATSVLGAAFHDPIYGGTCWSCPTGSNRTAAHVESNDACVKSTKASQVGKYGCAAKYGSSAFYDMIDGGTCWTCPSGYYRTLESVKSDKACAKGVFGPFSKATKKGIEGCDSGFKDIIYGGTCWTCPAGGKRTVYPVTADNACEVFSKATPRGASELGFTQLSNKAKDEVTSLANKFAQENPALVSKSKELYNSLNSAALASYFKELGDFHNQLANAEYQKIWNKLSPAIRPTLDAIKGQNWGYNSVTIGISGELGVLAGVLGEEGIVIDLNNYSVSGYVSAGFKVKLGSGISAGVSVSFWKSSPNMICGNGLGAIVALPGPGIAGLGGAIWVTPELICNNQGWTNVLTKDLVGFSAGIGVGVGVPFEISQAYTSTAVYKVGTNGKPALTCGQCGARGQRVCSITERFPSCNLGLSENCGICN